MAEDIAKTVVDQVAVGGPGNGLPKDLVARLVAIAGPDKGRDLRIASARIRIGRSRECEFVLQDSRASGSHCELEWKDGEFRIRDLGSTNGTELNGSAVTEYSVQDGDQIRIGRTTLMLMLDFRG